MGRYGDFRRAVLYIIGLTPLLAQNPTATLVGTVRDASGAAIPGAAVQVRNIETNDNRAVPTDPQGEFTIPNLPAGHYETVVTHTGFRTLHQTNIELQIDQTMRLEFKLELGAVSESVEVVASVPLLNTENAIKGEVMVTEEIVEMPLNGRDFSDLALLVPGVMPKAQGGQGSAFNVNGARADNTNFIIDGFNDQNPRGAAAQARPNLDALQEFKMQTSGYSAEYGRLAGGVMNMVLKTGSNQIHGTLFEFIRNDIFDARSFFDQEKTRLRRNQFGGTAGGPVWIPKVYNGRDRTFFLFSWESYRQSVGSTTLTRVPTSLERQGNFSSTGTLKDPLGGNFPGSVIPASRGNAVAQKFGAFFPEPNRPGQANNSISVASDRDTWDSFLMKLDHRFSTYDTISYRYTKRYNYTTNPFNGSDIGIFGSRVLNHQSLMGLSFTHMFSPVVINESRVGFSRTADRERGYNQGRDFAAEFGLPGTTTDPKLIGFPRFTVNGLAALGDGANMPVEFTVNNIQYGETLTWVRGKHLLKFGGEVLRTQFFQPYYNNNRGTFNFLGRWTNQPYADFVLGLPESSSRQVGTTPNYLFSTNYSLFAQDDWKLSSRLTINLGMRYEIPKPPREKYGRITNFIPELGRVILADDRTIQGTGIAFTDATKFGVARDFNLPAPLVYVCWGDIAPRVGFAWRPFGGNRAVVRGGYGIFYGTQVQNPVRNDLANVFPFAISQTINRKTNDPSYLTLSDPFPVAANLTSGVTNVNGFDLHAPTPYVQSWNLTLEREIGWSSAIEIAYVGSKGTHLGRKFDLNQPYRLAEFAPSFPRPYAGVNTINYYGFYANSIYNAGTIGIRRRFTRGFFYRVNYTYSKSIDEASQTTGNSDGGIAQPQNSRDLRAERGRSDWDIGHAVTMNFSYEVPWRKNILVRGWQLTGTGRAYTGQPFTPQVSNVNLNLGDANRPDRISKGTVEHPTAEQWFDIGAFPVLPTGSFRFGNSGRSILDGPGTLEVNLSLFKNFNFEKSGLQFRWEVFNAFNHANLNLPEVNVNQVTGATVKSAGSGRLMQFGLRYRF
jgi:outer membrane receptor protein involved in Fe transport